MPWIDWYNSLAKPSWTPTPATIGLIGQILYPIILVSFGFVFVQAFRGKSLWWVSTPTFLRLRGIQFRRAGIIHGHVVVELKLQGRG